MDKKKPSLVWLAAAGIFFFVGWTQKNQTFIVLAFSSVTFACSSYAIGGQKKGDRDREDGDHG
ncbi:putative membrane protein [Streptococcus sanguinis]|uniref:potassium transporter n=1 Tax=Streptococcus sanguinis TaxID=1305 RepID=UPI001CBDE8FA|nr:potassium transporter [Streptococcus sanguinis]MBZ2040501.1 potassium transporter [Streptococcus sanguinis]MCC3169873.1 putative membrane protein [Streptococcus sanguinis]